MLHNPSLDPHSVGSLVHPTPFRYKTSSLLLVIDSFPNYFGEMLAIWLEDLFCLQTDVNLTALDI